MTKETFPAKSLGAAIKSVRKSLGMTQVEFSSKIKATQSALANWEAGKKNPLPENLLKISRFTTDEFLKAQFVKASGLSAYVTEQTVSRLPTSSDYPTVNVRLLHDAAAAGTPRMINEHEIERTMVLPKFMFPDGFGEIIGIRVKGNSMEPMLLTGSIVFIDLSQRDPKRLVNAMVAARVDGGITIKFLRKMGKQYILIPFHVSPRYEVMPLSGVDGDAIVGRVLGWFSEPPTK